MRVTENILIFLNLKRYEIFTANTMRITSMLKIILLNIVAV